MLGVVFAQAEQGAVPAADAAGGAAGGGGSGMIFMMLAMFAIFYFLMIRPQQKREKERRELLAALGKGDRVVTTGGICGTIVGLTEKSVVLRVSDEPVVKMEFLRGAVVQVVTKDNSDKE